MKTYNHKSKIDRFTEKNNHANIIGDFNIPLLALSGQLNKT